jgi:hypothetical protein
MIAATFAGPNYFSPSYDETSIEVFSTLEDVIEALFDRYSSNGKREVAYETLDGRRHSTHFPGVEAGTAFTCFLLSEPVTWDNYADEENIETVMTAVHGGWKDYTVTLVESEQGSLLVTVERAGI